jgi:hypothetical protein
MAIPATALRSRPEPQRDRWGRYLIPDPVSGEVKAWTRATTFAATVADTFALTKWQLRQAAMGLAQREDLLAGVASVLDPDGEVGKKRLDELVQQAQQAVGMNGRATIGTALHSFTEAVDSGRKVKVPSQWEADVLAYRTVLQKAGIRVSRNYIERIACVPEFEVAGTLDRILAIGDRLLIGDIKTGTDLRFSWNQIAVQLSLYAHARTIWDPVEQRHHQMLPVDQERAIVIHLAAGQGRVQLYEVNLVAGWEAAQLCRDVRRWRARRDLALAVDVASV